MAAPTTPSDVAQLQLTVSTLAAQMSWFMAKLAEDDNEPADDSNDDNTARGNIDTDSIASTSSATRDEPVDVLIGLEAFYNAREHLAPEIDGQLANIVSSLCKTKMADDKLKEKMSAYVRSGRRIARPWY